MSYDKLREHLARREIGFVAFDTAAQAVDYLDKKIDQTTVGVGGSMTIRDIGLAERLATHNQLAWHWQEGSIEEANGAEVYLSSLNAIAETGELINIDGAGNRVAATAYGPKRVYFVIGKNKLAPDYEQALHRARNVAGPKNAARFQLGTPCVTAAPHCHDCNHPERICRALLVLWQKPRPVVEMEVILIEEDLGF